MQENNHCIVCHMPESNTRDIPHVTIHDHKIAIPPTQEQLNSERKFLGLVSVNNPDTDSLSIAKGYLLEYESYHSDEMYLDSAYHYLHLAGWLNENDNRNAIVNYYFLKEDYEAIVKIVEEIGSDKMLSEILVNQEYSNIDAWTAYRIGQAFESTGEIVLANKFYQRATALAKYNLEFQNKLGSTQVMLQQLDEAKKTFEFIISENPLFASAHVNYGYTLLMLRSIEQAEYHYDIALNLDPDQVQALLNKAGICFLMNKPELGEQYIDRVLLLEPDNEQAIMIKQRLN
jgi:tetratricopeptide (TPR) repeat protein